MVNINTISSLNEDSLKSLSHYGPVTSLKFHENYLLVGYGPILKVFFIIGNKVELKFSEQIFKRNKIHSISVEKTSGKIALSGGRSFAVTDILKILENSSIIEKAIHEWIICTEFLNSNELLMLTSHNMIYKIDIQSFKVIDTIHCEEKSILYSGSIRILENGDVFISAGTVMNGVILWELNKKKIIYRLTDHEGSIFGVKVDQTGSYLISCSDDRSLKLYDLKSGKLLASGWGHGSRIWNLEFYKNSETSIKILSTGEDCSTRIWQYEPAKSSLTQVDLWDNCHTGKHVWSADIDDEHLQLCATGGADGKVRIHDLSDRGILTSFPIETIQEKASVTLAKNEIIKDYSELSGLNLLVALTTRGAVFYLDQDNSNWTSISLSDDEKTKLDGFGIMQSCEKLNTVLICSRNGDILCLQFDSEAKELTEKYWIEDEHLDSNKVVNFLSFTSDSTFYALIDCPNPKIPFVLKKFAWKTSKLILTKSQTLEKPLSSITSTYMIINHTNNWLILGSRFASLVVYNLNCENPHISMGAVFKKICPGDTVTSISEIESSTGSLTLLTTVKDGVYSYVKITKNQEDAFTFDLLLQNKVSKGFVEGGFIDNNMNLILYGFKSSCFYIWNETKQLEIANESCGGSHRKWKLFQWATNELDYKFVYITKSTLNLFKFKSRFANTNYGLIYEGLHGREIRDVGISPELLDDNSRLLLSSAEDSTIKLSKIASTGIITNFWTMNNHISGMQRVAFMNETFAASSAANEEFIIWKLDKLTDGTPLIIEHTRLRSKNENLDLRVMDFDSYPVEDGFIITTVYSDSRIKVFHYNTTTKQFTYLVEDVYTTCCILNVKLFKLQLKIFLIIGATDGHLSIWEITNFVKNNSETKLGSMMVHQQLHQSGIKALTLIDNADGYNIVTGGDDNSIVLSSLCLKADKINIDIINFVPDAASATITSISSIGDEKIAVTSVDQIIRLWSFKSNELTCLSAKYTTIADTGCCDSAEFGKSTVLVAGGAGISAWNII